MDEIRKTRNSRLQFEETEEEHKKMIVAQEAYDREHNSDRYYFPKTRLPLRKSLKFDIKESEKMKQRPWYFWETEEGLEIGIVRARENLLFFLEDANIAVKILSDGIKKSVEETDTLKNVSLNARALAENAKDWLEGALSVATALSKNFQQLEKIKTAYFPKKLSPSGSVFAGLDITLAGDNTRKKLLKGIYGDSNQAQSNGKKEEDEKIELV